MSSKTMVLILLVALCGAAAHDCAEAVELTRLTQNERDDNWSSWSADDQWMLFSGSRRICEDGRWFCGPQDTWHLQTLDINVEPELWLTDAFHPRISPDGQWIAGMRQNGTDWDIWVWPANGSGPGVEFQSTQGNDERFPNWSNDSQYIAFDSNRLGRNEFQVYYAPVAIPDDPTAATRVTYIGSNNKHPTWNRDGTEIAYVGDADENRTISAVHLVTGEYRLITPHDGQNRHPDWSPDGRFIAFITDRWDGIGDVAIVRADGLGVPVRISVDMEDHDDFPEWSHDSQRIVFAGTTRVFPEVPNKEIYIASDLPFDEASVSAQESTMGSLKSRFRR